MKRILQIFILCCLSGGFNGFAQEEDIAATVQKLTEQIALLNNEYKVKVGEIVLRDSTFYSINRYNQVKTAHKIEKVKLEIENGTIVDVQIVDTNMEVFSNGSCPIELNRLNIRYDEINSENGHNEYVPLKDILYYERNGYYIPEDGLFELTIAKDTCVFRKSSSIHQNIDLRVYTDLLGMLGDESNGLVQTELNINSDIHRRNLWNKPYYIFKAIDFHFAASKFDSEFKAVNIDSTFTRSTLKQQAIINTELGLSLFAVRNFKGNYKLDLQVLGGFDLVKLKNNSTLDKTISQPYWGVSGVMVIKSSRNFSAKFKLPITFQFASYFRNHEVISGRKRRVLAPEVEFLWHPINNPRNALFARVQYVDINFNDDPFWRLQVGYNISISDAFSK